MVIALVLHVSLAFAPRQPFSPPTLRAALAEAASVWAPYGAAIGGEEPGGCDVDAFDRLTVIVIAAPPTASRASSPRPLGFVTFDRDGRPLPVITVLLDDLLRIVARAEVLGAREWQ